LIHFYKRPALVPNIAQLSLEHLLLLE